MCWKQKTLQGKARQGKEGRVGTNYAHDTTCLRLVWQRASERVSDMKGKWRGKAREGNAREGGGASLAEACARSAQKDGSLEWASGGDDGGNVNGTDGPVSCRSQGAGPN